MLLMSCSYIRAIPKVSGETARIAVFTGPHPELTANPNWPGSAVK